MDWNKVDMAKIKKAWEQQEWLKEREKNFPNRTNIKKTARH